MTNQTSNQTPLTNQSDAIRTRRTPIRKICKTAGRAIRHQSDPKTNQKPIRPIRKITKPLVDQSDNQSDQSDAKQSENRAPYIYRGTVVLLPEFGKGKPTREPTRPMGRPMTRSRRSARQAGTATERAVADYLAATLEDDRIDRRVKTGSRDKGDIANVRTRHGDRLVLEVKDCARTDIPGWTAQAHLEADNDDALAGVVIAKRRGTTDPGRYWVHMTVDDLCALLTGTRHGHRRGDLDA